MYTHKVFMVQLFQHLFVLVEQKTVGANQLPGAKKRQKLQSQFGCNQRRKPLQKVLGSLTSLSHSP